VRTTILHVITGLGEGGAQRSLYNLIVGLDRRRFRHIVASLRDGGVWVGALQRAGIDVAQLGWNASWDSPAGMIRLSALMRRVRPDIVHSWLYHADLAATLTAPRAAKLVWSLRNSDPSASGRASWRMLLRVLAALSTRPHCVVSNAARALSDHRALGYRPRAEAVIANGVDAAHFAPSDRAEARARLALPPQGLLIGMAARLDPFKDHATFLAAARLARAEGFDGAFVLAGAGTQKLSGDEVIALGSVADMPRFYGALDISTLSSSHGEGFPNVIVEAMACGIPVIATDVGDSAELLAHASGAVVPPRNPRALAGAWLTLARKSAGLRAAIGMAGRARVQEAYSLEAMTAAYDALYARLSSKR
jgi:glycosyltransferase involved in cell wall biosynthesis